MNHKTTSKDSRTEEMLYLFLAILLLTLTILLVSRRPTNRVKVRSAELEDSRAARDEYDPGWQKRA
jgi:hypothetical protein